MVVSRAYFGKADQGIARDGSAGDGREAGDATNPTPVRGSRARSRECQESSHTFAHRFARSHRNGTQTAAAAGPGAVPVPVPIPVPFPFPIPPGPSRSPSQTRGGFLRCCRSGGMCDRKCPLAPSSGPTDMDDRLITACVLSRSTRSPQPPTRAGKSKVINYCDLNDDEDFTCTKPPASKKPRGQMKQEKPSSKTSSKELHAQPSANRHTRKPLDQELYERDLEAALTLSLLHGTDEGNTDPTPTIHTEQYPTTEVADERQGEEKEDPSPLLFSNCSVNGSLLGLDSIHAERGSSKHKSSPRTSEPPRRASRDQDEDYKPKLTAESESDDNLSEVAESEDEEFTVRKVNKKSKKETTKMEKKTKPPPPPTSSKRDKQTSKPAKAKPPATVRTAASSPVRTPPPANQVSVPRRPPPPSMTSPSCKPAASPAGGSRLSKWNPPGQLGSCPSPSQGSALKSPGPGLGLRLGLSRRVRVKPLHPSVTSH
ncbi:unnamed protein product [Lota lota]